MAESVTIQAQKRTVTGKNVRKLREQGLIPGNLSGGEQPSVAIQLSAAELTHLLKSRHTGVLHVRVDSGIPVNALLDQVERDPISARPLHVDFRRVLMNKPVHAKVPLHLVGEAPAVKIDNGVLLHLLDTIEIEALPSNIPDAVTLDISSLDELNSLLTVADIQPVAGVTLLSPADEPVVTIKAPRIEVPETEAAAPATETPAPPPTESSETSANA